jgi:translation initiation factor 1
MSKDKHRKDRLGVVFSTSDSYDYSYDEEADIETLAPKDQQLYVYVDNKQRKGKAVTVIEGFVGKEDDLNDLAKIIKTKCGVGGSAKDGIILVQGEWKLKVKEILEKEHYKVKLKGG